MTTVELNLTREGVDVDCQDCGPLTRYAEHDDVAAAARAARAHIEDAHDRGVILVPGYDVKVTVGEGSDPHQAE